MQRLRRFAVTSALVVSAALALSPAAMAQEIDSDGTWQAVKQAGVLKCGAAVAAPYVMRNPRNGDYSGFFVDICRGFAKDVLHVEAEFPNTSWDNLVAGLQGGQWDLAMALNQTPERMKAIDFSDAVTNYQVSFVVNKDNPKLADVGNDLSALDKSDITFTVMSGTAQDKALSAKIHNARIMRLPGMDETRMALMSRRADVLADASDSNHLFALANPGWAEEIIPDPPLAKQPVSFGLRKGTDPADIAVLNAYIAQLHARGEIQRLVDKASRAAIDAK
ncbi:amino acid ABC transporter substrate-binding protein [Gammaproteobacteria bacterium MFB021]|nr:amino acid ABC transporter substrate-binding protein [Gammaproteobacteria bacterium MFB021]